MAGLENAGEGQFFRQNHVAQFIDRFFFFHAFSVLELLNSIQDLTKIARRINRDLVADFDAQLSRKLNAQHGRLAFKIQFPLLNELAQRNDFLFLFRIDATDHRREPAIFEFDDNGALNEGRGRDHAGRMVEVRLERPPVVQNVFADHENVGVEIDHLLPQLAIEPSHHRDDEDEHGYTERHPQDRDQCNDREKGALRFQIPQCEEKTKRQFQFADTVAVNSLLFNRGAAETSENSKANADYADFTDASSA